MKIKRNHKLTVGAVGVLAALLVHTQAASLSGPLGTTDFNGFTSGASYGPPAGANFVDGPIVVPSGSQIDLFAGNQTGRAGVDSLVFVLSMTSGSLAELGAGNVSFQFVGAGAPVSFSAANFFSTSALGFPIPPDSIAGIGNGEVNGVKFPSALHAGVQLTGLSLGNVEGADLGDIFVNTPVNLRVDIFGIDSNGNIINNTPNSHSIGVPEPVTILGTVLALGLGFVFHRRYSPRPLLALS